MKHIQNKNRGDVNEKMLTVILNVGRFKNSAKMHSILYCISKKILLYIVSGRHNSDSKIQIKK